MITPENENNVPLDDSDSSETDDQQSQQDIHSNGFDDDADAGDDKGLNADQLQQASDASEAAFTLDVDKGIAPKTEKKEDTNIKE